MCFSAGASFGASAVISVIGVTSIKKAQQPSQYLFAGIPLIFAIQQFFEGLLWVALTNAHYAFLQEMATYVFLIFSQLFWPLAVPLSILLLEKKSGRKKILIMLLGLGVFVSGYLMVCFLNYPLYAECIDKHIYYHLDFPYAWEWYSGLFYLVPTIIPPFISSVNRMKELGIAILISYIISKIFFAIFVISVWCFFAAILSFVVLFIMEKIQSPEEKNQNG